MCLRLWSQVFPRPGFTSSHLDRSIPLTRLGVVPATETETQLEVAATDGGLFLSFETKFKGESYAPRYQGPRLRLSFWPIRSCTGSHPHGDKGAAVAPAILPAFQTESMGLAGGRALIPPDLARLPPPRPKGFLGNPTMTYTVFSFDRPYHLGTPPPYINQDSLPSKKGTMGIHSVGGQQI